MRSSHPSVLGVKDRTGTPGTEQTTFLSPPSSHTPRSTVYVCRGAAWSALSSPFRREGCTHQRQQGGGEFRVRVDQSASPQAYLAAVDLVSNASRETRHLSRRKQFLCPDPEALPGLAALVPQDVTKQAGDSTQLANGIHSEINH